MTLAQRLKNLKQQLGITQRELAKRLLIHESQVSRLLHGENASKSKLLLRAIRELEISAGVGLASVKHVV